MPFLGIAFSGRSGNQPQSRQRVQYVNVRFQPADWQRSNAELLTIMLVAIRDRRASITPTAIGRSAASSLTYSIKVVGNYGCQGDIYNKAAEYVWRWKIEEPRRGLPFPRRAIF